jgi:hypothetical protein
MSRNKRITIILLAGLFLLLLLLNWTHFQGDFDPRHIGFPFLLLSCLLHFLISFTALEFLVFTLTMVPGLYSLFHFHAGLLPGAAYLLVLRCGLALVLYFLIVAFSEYFRHRLAKKVFRLFVSVCVPILWALFLLERNIVFSLSLILFTGVSWYYLRSYEKRV